MLFFTMFLLGLYAGKRRIFQEFERHRVLIRIAFFWGLPLGLLAMTSDWIFRDLYRRAAGRTPVRQRGGVGVRSHRVGHELCGGPRPSGSEAAMAAVALPAGRHGPDGATVYLTQSILITTFMGYGFGQNQRVGPAGIFGYAALIYAVQLATCVWWMKRFQFGPAEWLWRTLTYLRWQPMRLPRSETVAAKAPAGGAQP